MSRSPKSPWPALISVALLGSLVWAGIQLRSFLARDPLAGMRYEKSQKDEEAAIEMENVTLRHYDSGKLVHQAKVNRFAISNDRRVTTAETISEGAIWREGKKEIGYKATKATWDDYLKQLHAFGTIQFSSPNFQLTTTDLTFDQPKGKLNVSKPLQGKFYGGDLKATKFEGDLKMKRYTAYSVAWQGAAKPEVVDRPPRKWRVKAATFTAISEDQVEYIKPEASDTEIAVKADRGSWDRKKDIFVAVGNVRYYSSDVNLTCERVTIYRKERRALLEGRVSMLIKPEDQRKLEVVELQPMRPIVPEEIVRSRPSAPPLDRESNSELRSAESRRKYPVSVLASKIEYWYGKEDKRANIIGSPQARQDLGGGRWRQIWCHAAFWNGKTEMLQLSSASGSKTVRFMTSLGDDLKARSASISTKEGDERYSVQEAEGDVYSDDDEDIPRPQKDGKSPPSPDLKGNIG